MSCELYMILLWFTYMFDELNLYLSFNQIKKDAHD